MAYVDGFVVPVPKRSRQAYVRMARKAGKVWRDHGALEYRECIADDVKWGKRTSFPRSVKLKAGEVVWFSFIVYKSRKDRDRVNAKVMKDPRLADMMDPKGMPFDAKRMIYGGFKVTHLTLDLRPGGTMHYRLRMPDGKDLWGRFVYREIVKPERLVWINSFSDKDGGLATHPMSPTWPREMHTTVTFKELGGKTEVTVTWLPLEGSTDLEIKTFEEGRDSMKGGWTGTLEQFNAYLAKG